MPTPLWLPSEVLKLDLNSSDFTCIGYAPSKGRRCHNPIACANRQEAANILREMSTLDPHSKRLDKRLEQLAPRLLCRRWHQNQAADMKTLWRREIDRYHPAAVHIERYAIVERYTVFYAPSVAVTSTLVRIRAKPRTIGQTTSLVAHSPVQVFTPQTLPVTTTPEPRTRSRRSNDMTRQESRQQEEPNPASSPQPHSTGQERNPPERNSPPPSPVTTPAHNTSGTAPQESTTTREEVAHIDHIPEPTATDAPHEESLHTPTRRPLEADCPICCEELSSDDATVWCKAQCRQNFHAGCIETWHGFQEAQGRRMACPYW